MAIIVWKNISVLRGIAICSVVLAHTSAASFGPFFSQLQVFSPSQFPFEFSVIVIIKSFAHFGIPAFIFSSGFMLYRMYHSWHSVRKIAFDLFKKYMIWAVPLYILISIKQGEIEITEILLGLIEGGPMPAYWFFVLIIEIFLLSPIWIYLVKNHQKSAFLIMLYLQFMVFFRHYYGGLVVFPNTVEWLIIRPLHFSPPFIAGLILSDNVRGWIPVLETRRPLLVVLTFVSACLCISESVLGGYLDNWSTNNSAHWFATEKISLMCFFVTGTLLIITFENKKNSLKAWFSNVGLASFGVFLMTDIFTKTLTTLIWHAPVDWLFFSMKEAYGHNNMPAWLPEFSIWILPLYFVNGLWGPLLSMKWLKGFLGNKVRFLW